MIRLTPAEVLRWHQSIGWGQRRARMPVTGRSTLDWADVLAAQIHGLGLTPEPVREYRFDLLRKWRMDLAWPAWKIFAECDGGEWTHGRHGRGKGMMADCEKWNAASLDGWRGFRFAGAQVKSGYAIGIIEQILKPSERRA